MTAPLLGYFNRTYKEWAEKFVDKANEKGYNKDAETEKDDYMKSNTFLNEKNITIPIQKFTEYALNTNKNPDKSIAFKSALGYDLNNVDKLIHNIKTNLKQFEAIEKGDYGYGMTYQVVLRLMGENGKSANVLTGWIKDIKTNELRLTSAYITKKKVRDIND